MFRLFAEIILKNRLLFVGIFVLITVFMGFQAKDLHMSYKLAQMLPQNDSAFIQYNQFKKTFGEDGSIIVVGNRESRMFSLDYFREYVALHRRIKKIEGIKNVACIANVVYLNKDTSLRKFTVKPVFPDSVKSQAQLDSLGKQLYSFPFYDNILYKREDQVFLSLITMKKDALNSRQRMKTVQAIEDELEAFKVSQQTELHVSGLPYIRTVNMRKASRELVVFVLLAALVTAIVLFIIFRSFYEVFFPVLMVLFGVVWAQGAMALLGYEITILTGLIPPLLIVIGIPNSIYIINKYHQEYNRMKDKKKALAYVIEHTGNAIFLTNLTTAIGFATFIITRSDILKEFGLVASLNVMLLFVLSMIFIPVVFSWLPPPSSRATAHLDTRLANAVIKVFVLISQYYRRQVYWATLAICVISLYGISRIQVRGNIVDDLPSDSPVLTDLRFFETHFGGVMPMEITIDTKTPNGILKQARTWKKIDELQEFLASYKIFSKPVSVIELIKFSNQAFYNGDSQEFKLPAQFDRAFILSYIKKEEGRDTLLQNFLDSTRQTARVSVQMANISTPEIAKVRDEVKAKTSEIFPSEDYNVTVTGASIAFMEGTRYLVKNLLSSLVLAIVIIAFFMAVMFRKFKMVIISLIPNIIPLIFTAGLMGYFGIPLKPSTVLIFSVAFGISVDDTIHYLSKLRQELPKHGSNMRSAVVISLKETGISMAYTSIVLFFGFSVFAASEFGGTVALGTLVSLTLLSAMFTNLILLPALLMTTHESKGKKQHRKNQKSINKA